MLGQTTSSISAGATSVVVLLCLECFDQQLPGEDGTFLVKLHLFLDKWPQSIIQAAVGYQILHFDNTGLPNPVTPVLCLEQLSGGPVQLSKHDPEAAQNRNGQNDRASGEIMSKHTRSDRSGSTNSESPEDVSVMSAV